MIYVFSTRNINIAVAVVMDEAPTYRCRLLSSRSDSSMNIEATNLGIKVK